jgi:hypothetical protein
VDEVTWADVQVIGDRVAECSIVTGRGVHRDFGVSQTANGHVCHDKQFQTTE